MTASTIRSFAHRRYKYMVEQCKKTDCDGHPETVVQMTNEMCNVVGQSCQAINERTRHG